MVSSNASHEILIKDLLQALWQKKWFILSVTLLCAILGFSYANYSKPLYKASAVILPPSTSTALDLNETHLKLFTVKKVFDLFSSILKSEDSKYFFFKEHVLPVKNGSTADSEYKLYQEYSKALRIDMIPGTNHYKISFTHTNPLLITQEINQYIQFINQKTYNEVMKISKHEHERKALLLQQDIDFIKNITKKRIRSQLIVLQEALEVAEAAGIKQPSKNKELIASYDFDPSHLYHNGSEPLKALILNLSKRTNHEAFIPNLEYLIQQRDFYQNYQLKPKNIHLYQVDGLNLPLLCISFSKQTMIVTALLLGLLSSILLVLIQTHLLKNRQSFTRINDSNQNENFAFR